MCEVGIEGGASVNMLRGNQGMTGLWQVGRCTNKIKKLFLCWRTREGEGCAAGVLRKVY